VNVKFLLALNYSNFLRLSLTVYESYDLSDFLKCDKPTLLISNPLLSISSSEMSSLHYELYGSYVIYISKSESYTVNENESYSIS